MNLSCCSRRRRIDHSLLPLLLLLVQSLMLDIREADVSTATPRLFDRPFG